MRRLDLALLVLLLAPPPATAQPLVAEWACTWTWKHAEKFPERQRTGWLRLVDDPSQCHPKREQPVDLTPEPDTPPAPARVAFLGTTTATVDGYDALGMIRACAAEFPGSHVCTASEIQASATAPEITAAAHVQAPDPVAACSTVLDADGGFRREVCEDANGDPVRERAAVACCGLPLDESDETPLP